MIGIVTRIFIGTLIGSLAWRALGNDITSASVLITFTSACIGEFVIVQMRYRRASKR